MLFTALRDLQWRRRRFLIAAIGTALVFAMSLLLSGLSNAFETETDRWLQTTGADLYIVKQGQSGPLTGFAPFDVRLAEQVRGTPGITEAAPMVYVHGTIAGAKPKDVNVFALGPSDLGWPEL